MLLKNDVLKTESFFLIISVKSSPNLLYDTYKLTFPLCNTIKFSFNMSILFNESHFKEGNFFSILYEDPTLCVSVFKNLTEPYTELINIIFMQYIVYITYYIMYIFQFL